VKDAIAFPITNDSLNTKVDAALSSDYGRQTSGVRVGILDVFWGDRVMSRATVAASLIAVTQFLAIAAHSESPEAARAREQLSRTGSYRNFRRPERLSTPAPA
jgi:hypothetical protein